MAIRDLFLPLLSYPEPTPLQAIAAVKDVARSWSRRKKPHASETEPVVHTRISALVLETEIGPNLYYEGADIGVFTAQESARSRGNAKALFEAFAADAKDQHVQSICRIVKRGPSAGVDLLVQEARVHHMTALPIARDDAYHREIAERLVFESGRPILIFPQQAPTALPKSFGAIAVAWDGSRQAARAVADAMPFLRRADRVQIFSVTDDKPMDLAFRGHVIADQLNAEGVTSVYEEVRKNATPEIGRFMTTYLANHGIDLLVMGGYGHSRLREFVLGGATRSVLMDPPGWVMLSH